MSDTPPELMCTFCGTLLTNLLWGGGDAEYFCKDCEATYVIHYEIDPGGITRLHIKGQMKKGGREVTPLPLCTTPTRCRLFKYPNVGKRGTLDQTDCKFLAVGDTCSHPRRA